MIKISRIARVFARDFAQEAPSNVFATYRADDSADDTYEYQHQGEGTETTLEPFPPNSSTSGSQERRLTPARNRSGAFDRLKKAAGDPRVRLIQNQCLKMSLSIFNRTQRRTRSLGCTSACCRGLHLRRSRAERHEWMMILWKLRARVTYTTSLSGCQVSFTFGLGAPNLRGGWAKQSQVASLLIIIELFGLLLKLPNIHPKGHQVCKLVNAHGVW